VGIARLGDSSLGGCRVRNVAGDANTANVARLGLGRRLVDVEQSHAASASGQTLRCCGAQPRCAARYDRRLAVETHDRYPHPVMRLSLTRFGTEAPEIMRAA
jgi:hypothetical protein